MISTYELEVVARTCANISRAVLGPCAQFCPCEAMEHKRPKIPKPKRKEIELSSNRHSICLNELIILVWSKSDEK